MEEKKDKYVDPSSRSPFKSKKWWTMLLGVLAPLAYFYLGLPEELVTQSGIAVITYIVGQTVIDFKAQM